MLAESEVNEEPVCESGVSEFESRQSTQCKISRRRSHNRLRRRLVVLVYSAQTFSERSGETTPVKELLRQFATCKSLLVRELKNRLLRLVELVSQAF